MAQCRVLIFLGHDFFAVRVMEHDIFAHRITRIADRKMRARFFRDQDRKFGLNVVFPAHLICRRIRSDRKFSHRKRLPVIEDIFPDIRSIFLFRAIIRTTVTGDHPVLKFHAQIVIPKSV